MAKKKRPAAAKGQPSAALAGLENMAHSFERAVYGTVAPGDARKPAIYCGIECDRIIADADARPDWGAALLHLLVAAGRQGLTLAALVTEAMKHAAVVIDAEEARVQAAYDLLAQGGQAPV